MALGFTENAADVSDTPSQNGAFAEIPGDPGKDETVFAPVDPGRDEEVPIPADPGRDESLTDASKETEQEISAPKENAGEMKETEDPAAKMLTEILSNPEKLKALLDQYPEKKDKILNEIDKLNNENASPVEKQAADRYLKGTILELAAKDVLKSMGLTVEDKQRAVAGENGATRPDIIAKNETDKTIRVFGCDIKPGQTISVECKCGGKAYLTSELKGHIPNQLSGHEGHSVLLTTSDIRGVDPGLVKQACSQKDTTTTLSVVGVSAGKVAETAKEVKK